MKLIIPSLLLFILTTACSPKPEPLSDFQLSPTDLTGKLYFFAPLLDTTRCLVTGECDCCTDNLYFVNDHEFVRDLYCMEKDQIHQGKYRIENGKLILDYAANTVNAEYNWAKDEDTTKRKAKEHLISRFDGPTFTDTIEAQNCHGEFILFDKGKRGFFYGQIDKQQKPEAFELQLKNSRIWGELKF